MLFCKVAAIVLNVTVAVPVVSVVGFVYDNANVLPLVNRVLRTRNRCSTARGQSPGCPLPPAGRYREEDLVVRPGLPVSVPSKSPPSESSKPLVPLKLRNVSVYLPADNNPVVGLNAPVAVGVGLDERKGCVGRIEHQRAMDRHLRRSSPRGRHRALRRWYTG